MPEKVSFSIIWTDKAMAGSTEIKLYLRYYFSETEIDNYLKLLESFEKIILSFPQLYPLSGKNKKVRRAVLSKQLSVFYSLKAEFITIVAVLDNRMSDARRP